MTIMSQENWLRSRVRSSPTQIALSYRDKKFTYSEMFSEVRLLAGKLKSAGIKESDRMAILLPNIPEFIFFIHAAIELGVEMVLLNARLTTDELNTQIQRADVNLLIRSNEFADLDVNSILITDLKNMKYLSYEPYQVNMEDICTLVFTSGTTGTPKLVPLTYNNHFYSAMSSAYRLGVLISDRWLLNMPLFHLGGLAIVFRSCIYGISIYLQNKFEESQVITAIREEKVTIASFVPTMLKRLLSADKDNVLEKLRFVLLGGASASNELLNTTENRDISVSTTYGMTETASQICTATPSKAMRKKGTVGKPLFLADVKIKSEEEEVSQNEIGDIRVSGPMVFAGYENTNSQAFDDEGYFITGDIGYIDEDGDLFVLQRREDLIISGGENIYPAEIEQIMRGIPEITEVIVVGISDREWGEQPVAVVKLTQPISNSEIISYLKDKLAGYKLPVEIYRIDQYPKTSSGKIQRPKLLELIKNGKLTKIN